MPKTTAFKNLKSVTCILCGLFPLKKLAYRWNTLEYISFNFTSYTFLPFVCTGGLF